MENADKNQKSALKDLPDKPGYEVGYGKPPVATRFKPGRSGNPHGRPRGAKSKRPALHEERMKGIILDEAYRTIKVNDGARQVAVPIVQAVIRSLAVNAARGNQRAQRLFTELLFTTERQNKQLYDEWLDTAINYKVQWERELERRERLGVTGPEPLPHPDHVIVDMRGGEVRIKGPATKEEKAQYEEWREQKKQIEVELEEMQQLQIDDPDCQYRDQVLDDIEHTKRILDLITKVVPD